MRILDNEGESIVNLVDVANKSELHRRFDQEDQDLMACLYDTPFFADPIGAESDYKNTEENCKGLEEITATYSEWMEDCLNWAKDCLGK